MRLPLRWPTVILILLAALVVTGVVLEQTHAFPVGDLLLSWAGRIPVLEDEVATYRLGEERSEAFAQRAAELAAREAELAQQAAALEAERARLAEQEAALERQAQELAQREAALQDQAAELGAAVVQTARSERLYAIFGEMRPRDAARLAGQLPPEEAARMLLTLSEREAAAILAEMETEQAAQLSRILVGL